MLPRIEKREMPVIRHLGPDLKRDFKYLQCLDVDTVLGLLLLREEWSKVQETQLLRRPRSFL